jgi:parallel beta-helix repeat protein
MNKIPKSGYIAMVALFTMCFCMETVDAQAATYFVATTGNDGFAGTSTQPFRTIARGLSSLKAGDILYIRAGTYNENIDSEKQTIPTGTSWGDAPLISAYSGESVTLNGTINIAHTYVQYVEFARLKISTMTNTNVSIGGLQAPHHVKLTDLDISNGTNNCVQFGTYSHHVWMNGGKVYHCGWAANPQPGMTGYPFYASGNDHLVENVEIYDTPFHCYHLYHSSLAPARHIIRNNKLHHCGSMQASSGTAIMKGADHQFYNNIIYAASGHGVIILSGNNQQIYNNTVYGGRQTGIYVQNAATNTTVKNNISYGNATTQILDEGTGTILSKNLTSDPRFINASSLDFNLQTSSPAIDAGEFLSLVTMDVRKTPRPQGATHDIGAFESTGSNVSAPSPPRNLSVR